MDDSTVLFIAWWKEVSPNGIGPTMVTEAKATIARDMATSTKLNPLRELRPLPFKWIFS